MSEPHDALADVERRRVEMIEAGRGSQARREARMAMANWESDRLIGPPERAFAVLLGFDTSPRSYEEIRVLTNAAYLWMQWYEISEWEVLDILRTVQARHNG